MTSEVTNSRINQVASLLNAAYVNNKKIVETATATSPEIPLAAVPNGNAPLTFRDIKIIKEMGDVFSDIWTLSYQDAASMFKSNLNEIDDESQSILVRFAIKFLFDKARHPTLIKAIVSNSALEKAIRGVLSGIDDGGKALERFDSDLKSERNAVPNTKTTNTINARAGSIVHQSERNIVKPNIYTNTNVPITFTNESEGYTPDSTKAPNQRTQTPIHKHPPTRAHYEIVGDAMTWCSAARGCNAVGLQAKQDNPGSARTDLIKAQDGAAKAKESVKQAQKVAEKIFIEKGSQHNDNIVVALGTESFEHVSCSGGTCFILRPGVDSKSSVEKLIQSGLTPEEAEKTIVEKKKDAEIVKQVVENDKKLDEIDKEMDALIVEAQQQIDYIDEQLSYLQAKSEVIMEIQKAFEKLEITFPGFFGVDMAMHAAKAMIVAMLNEGQKEKQNNVVIAEVLNDKLKLLRNILSVDEHPRVVFAIDSMLNMQEKKLQSNYNLPRMA